MLVAAVGLAQLPCHGSPSLSSLSLWLSGLLPSSVFCVLFSFNREDDTEGDLAKKGRPSPWRFPIRTGQLGLSRSPRWRGWGGTEELMAWEMAGQGARSSLSGGVAQGSQDETMFRGKVDRMTSTGRWGRVESSVVCRRIWGSRDGETAPTPSKTLPEAPRISPIPSRFLSSCLHVG